MLHKAPIIARSTIVRAATAATLGLVPVVVSAHAFVDHAVPAAGATVAGAPDELKLTFTEGVVVALSGVKISTAAGAAIAAAKPTGDPASRKVLHVHLGQKLAPGTYTVRWHAVATDTHPSSGSYAFTVAP